jgi:hypothetical protein
MYQPIRCAERWSSDGRQTARLRERASVLRRIVNEDVADGVLLDVREVSLPELLLLDGEGSGLIKALNRLLSSNIDTNFNSFSSSI